MGTSIQEWTKYDFQYLEIIKFECLTAYHQCSNGFTDSLWVFTESYRSVYCMFLEFSHTYVFSTLKLREEVLVPFCILFFF